MRSATTSAATCAAICGMLLASCVSPSRGATEAARGFAADPEWEAGSATPTSSRSVVGDTVRRADDPYRLRYHFSPARNWMNDPNGLLCAHGTYHLFYQHNPHGAQWGHMSWGHATSSDLLRWRERPVAIPETDSTMAFSGSAVWDASNTSGFGSAEHPPLVAVYTAHYPGAGRQAQALAYSTDGGASWSRYRGNPVLDVGLANFRDPNVFWYGPDERWIMVVALPDRHQVQFYGSENLIDWTHLSTFGPQGATGGIWECPDLFRVPVEGRPGEERWVLEVDLNPGSAAGGSGGQYFVGTFDGRRFTVTDDGGSYPRWVDYGADFYAAIDWENLPSAREGPIWAAWMSNWLYAGDTPTGLWRGALTIPRRLRLEEVGGSWRLIQEPIPDVETLRGPRRDLEELVVADSTIDLTDRGLSGQALDLRVRLEPGSAEDVGLAVRTGDGEATRIGFRADFSRIYVDRRRSGRTGFHEQFPARHEAPLDLADGALDLRVLVDASSVEVFAEGGRRVFTERIFPSPSSRGVAVYAHGGEAVVRRLSAWPMESVWTSTGE